MPAPRQQESRPRVLCVLGFGNDAQAFGSLVPAARQRSSCSEYKSRRSLYHTEQVQEPTSCAPCALFLGRSTTWSALLVQRSLHSRTALLCAASRGTGPKGLYPILRHLFKGKPSPRDSAPYPGVQALRSSPLMSRHFIKGKFFSAGFGAISPGYRPFGPVP